MMRFLSLIFAFLFPLAGAFAAGSNLENDINIRDITITDTAKTNTLLEDFTTPIENFFFTPDIGGGDGLLNTFIVIAFQIKNLLIVVAVIFLIIGVIKLLFSSSDEEAIKKWK
jgi:hypothetical protein